MTDTLEDGFYWVRLGGFWLPSLHNSEKRVWLVTGSTYPMTIQELDEIDPRPIEREGAEMARALLSYELDTLRALNGQAPEGYVAGAASVVCAAALKHMGLAEGHYTISQKGRDYLAALDTAAPQATCSCDGIDLGTYDAQVELVPPPHLARTDGRGICVDACLALEIAQLWKQGIATTGCCCGHNKAAPYIGVIEDHIPAMLALGYEIQTNPNRPGAQDSFTPKSIRRVCA